MTKEQSITFELLLVFGLALLVLSMWGHYLGNLVEELTTYHKVGLEFNPLSNKKTQYLLPGQAPSGGGEEGQPANCMWKVGNQCVLWQDEQGRIHILPDWAPSWMR